MDKYSHTFPPKVSIEVNIDGSASKVEFTEPAGMVGELSGYPNNRKKLCCKEYGTPAMIYCVQPIEGETWESVDDPAELDWTSHPPQPPQ
jgi:hypothetical protein